MDRGRRYAGKRDRKKMGTEGRTDWRRGVLGEIYYAEESERNGREPFRSLTHFVTGRCARKLSLFFGPQR